MYHFLGWKGPSVHVVSQCYGAPGSLRQCCVGTKWNLCHCVCYQLPLNCCQWLTRSPVVNVKVLVKTHKDKVFPDTFKWYHTNFIHTKMETFPSFIPLLVLDFEAANRYVQLLVCHSSVPKSCWKFLEHRSWFWWENQWRVKDTSLLSKDQSCRKFPFLVDFRVGLRFFFPCTMELWLSSDTRHVRKVQGGGRVCVDSGDLCVTLHSGSQSEMN